MHATIATVVDLRPSVDLASATAATGVAEQSTITTPRRRSLTRMSGHDIAKGLLDTVAHHLLDVTGANVAQFEKNIEQQKIWSCGGATFVLAQVDDNAASQ